MARSIPEPKPDRNPHRWADWATAAAVGVLVALVFWLVPIDARAQPAATAPAAASAPASTGDKHHRFDCAAHSGVQRARCERHERMFAVCGSVKGEAHFDCDRTFLLANPLACERLNGDDAKACGGEVAAMRSCEPQAAGRAFLRCVRDTIKASPMGPH